jgi:MscS family membrane protein
MQEWLQPTCLEILRRFNDEGINFAFPSRTLYLANDDKRQLKLKMLKGETATYIPEGGSHE